MSQKRHIIAVCLVSLAMAALSKPAFLHAEPASIPAVELRVSAGPVFSRTSLPDMNPGIQGSLGASFGASVQSAPFLPSPGLAAMGTLEFSIFNFAQSAVTSDGQLYRAWQGLGLDLMGGLVSGAIMLPLVNVPAEFSLQAGAGLRAARYTGTGLVSAYPAFLARLALEFVHGSGPGWGLALPFEYATKAGASIFVFGLCGIWRIR